MAETIICRSYQSFIDVCDNKLVKGLNVHCTFSVTENELEMMKYYLTRHKGCDLSVTLVVRKR